MCLRRAAVSIEPAVIPGPGPRPICRAMASRAPEPIPLQAEPVCAQCLAGFLAPAGRHGRRITSAGISWEKLPIQVTRSPFSAAESSDSLIWRPIDPHGAKFFWERMGKYPTLVTAQYLVDHCAVIARDRCVIGDPDTRCCFSTPPGTTSGPFGPKKSLAIPYYPMSSLSHGR